MRLLGIDFGTKKIGLAVSDANARIAFPLAVIEAGSDFSKIKNVCRENEISKIVLGRPLGYKGDPAEILKEIEKFKIKLEKETGLPVVYENEVLTTQQAKRVTGKTKKTDASAAALILQTYLDK